MKNCDSFYFEMITWDSANACSKASLQETLHMSTMKVDADPQSFLVPMSESGNICQNNIKLEGSESIDYRVTVDFSESFYRPELVLQVANAGDEVIVVKPHST